MRLDLASSLLVLALGMPASAQTPPPPPAADPARPTVPNFDAVFAPVMTPPTGGQTQPSATAAPQPTGALPPTPKAENIDLREVERMLSTWENVESTLRQQERPKALVSRTVAVSLSPGASSPTVPIPHNYVVVLEFLDNSGSPWPIRKVLTGSKDAFLVEQGVSAQDAAPTPPPAPPAAAAPTYEPAAPQNFAKTPADATVETVEAPAPTPPDGSNILLISALAPYAASNVAVLLQGASSPISFAIHAVEPSAKEAYTDRYTMLLDGFGPYAPPLRDSSGPADTLGDVVAVLANQPPREGANLVVAQWPGTTGTLTGAPRIWRDGGTLWLRTQDTLLSPAPTAKVSRGDWKAYRLNYLPVLLLSRDGRTYQVTVR